MSYTTPHSPQNISVLFKYENSWNEYFPAYIIFHKAGIVLHTDRDQSFVRLDNGDKRDTDIS